MLVKNAEKEEKKKEKIQSKKKEEVNKKLPKWKRQSEMFRNIIKNGRIADSGGNVVVPKQQDDYDGLVHCEICNRRYNEQAFNKHLPTCQRKQKEKQIKGKSSTNTNTKPNLNVRFNKKK